MNLVIGSDHGGWELKEFLKPNLVSLGNEIEDIGCYDQESVDYPDIAQDLVSHLLESKVKKGILICGTGIGMSMAANRFKGIRAALCHEPMTARLSREHNDANVLVLGGRVLGKELALEIVKIWLATPFAGGRHLRRLTKIEEIS